MNLYDIKQGDKCIITKVKGRGAFRKRIMEMGFVAGKEIIVGGTEIYKPTCRHCWLIGMEKDAKEAGNYEALEW